MYTKVDIFSGFLGAGKTTLIKKLIDEEFYREKIVIIENEFGQVGIDGAILKKSNIEVKEINAGCICCSVAGDFNKAINEVVQKFKPDRIIIEPSGVAKLSEIIAACKVPELKNVVHINMSITVVDVLKFDLYIKNFGEFYKNQIVNAKTIVLSRTQNAAKEKTLKVVEEIQSLNTKANIITTSLEQLKGNRIVEVAEKAEEVFELEKVNLVKKPMNKGLLKTRINHTANEMFQTWGIETPKIFSRERLKEILNKIEKDNLYGTVLRAKGIVQCSEAQWIQFDYVPGEFEVRNISPDYIGRICVIGSNLNKDKIKAIF